MFLSVCSFLFIYLYYLLCYDVVVVFFFFFKQKTAYEMRISDWSSDVCSSDLQRAQLAQVRPARSGGPQGTGPGRGGADGRRQEFLAGPGPQGPFQQDRKSVV